MKLSWWQALRVYAQPRMVSMLLLGFSAGLPFYLIYQTLSAWLRTAGIQRSTIGMLAWVGLAYSLKFLWAPVVDRLPIPVLTRLVGRRRSWMLFAQFGLVAGLAYMSTNDPLRAVLPMALCALFIAFCAATQDIAIDAWRIESAPVDDQGAMAAAYQLGYRAALIVGGAGALALADDYGWRFSYLTMAALVGVGVLTTVMTAEPVVSRQAQSFDHEQRVVDWLQHRPRWPHWLRTAGSWFVGAVICPFTEFFTRYGLPLALLILCFMSGYRLTDFAMGSMTNSFYIDKGFSLREIAAVVKFYGLLASLVGVVIAGVVIAKIGLLRSLVVGSLMVMVSNCLFSVLAGIDKPSLLQLGMVNGFDNLALAMHGTALIAFLSSLTSARYTATQYALFSSFYALFGKILEGFSGFVVDGIGYQLFFVYTASLSVPALLMLLFLVRRGVVPASRN